MVIKSILGCFFNKLQKKTKIQVKATKIYKVKTMGYELWYTEN